MKKSIFFGIITGIYLMPLMAMNSQEIQHLRDRLKEQKKAKEKCTWSCAVGQDANFYAGKTLCPELCQDKFQNEINDLKKQIKGLQTGSH